MTVYHYPSPSPIDEVDIVITEQGGMRAYLHAREGMDQSKVKAVIDSVHEKGWSSVPFMFNTKPVLEVRGCRDEKKLIKDLEESGFVSGKPTKGLLTSDQVSFLDKVRKRTLQAAGVFYTVGDIGFITYGWKESHPEDMLAGLFYALGTQSLVWYGRNDQSDLQVKDMAKQMHQYMQKTSATIPENCSLRAINEDHDKGLISKVDDMWRRYPSEVFNVFTGVAGLFVAYAAGKHKAFAPRKPGMDAHAHQKMRHEGWMDVGLGSMTVASTFPILFIPERKADPDDPPPRDMLEKTWNWIREKPLRLTGYGLMISTLCHAQSTYVAYNEAKRVGDKARLSSVPFRALFVGTNILAEILTSISSKGHGEGVTTDDSVKESVYAMAAELIVKQPPVNRQWHIQHVAHFLEQPTVLAESQSVVIQKLQQHVAQLEKNPWVCETTPQKSVEAPNAQQASPASPALEEKTKPEEKNWVKHQNAPIPAHLVSVTSTSANNSPPTVAV